MERLSYHPWNMGLKPVHLGALLSLLVLCSCATEKFTASTASSLPPDVTMNKDAGVGSWVIVTLHLDDGKGLPFVVDTGNNITIFDESLAPKLGKCLGTGAAWNFGVKHEVKAFAAPRLYLGNVQLLTDSKVGTVDLRKFSDKAHPIKGILGMDVLKQYCVQLDFTKSEMRFLDDKLANKGTWGDAISLADAGDNCFCIQANLTGAKGADSLIDSGCDGDGWLTPELYLQWTNQTTLASNGNERSPNGVLDGQKYYDLNLNEQEPSTDDGHTVFNGIGLHVLSQSLVTFDFPARTMYLKRATEFPLYDKETIATAFSHAKSAAKFLRRLKDNGRLPGWLKTEKVSGHATYNVRQDPNIESVTWDVPKIGSLSIYHYTVTRKAKGPWKLEKAWRTDENGTIQEQYPLPAS